MARALGRAERLKLAQSTAMAMKAQSAEINIGKNKYRGAWCSSRYAPVSVISRVGMDRGGIVMRRAPERGAGAPGRTSARASLVILDLDLFGFGLGLVFRLTQRILGRSGDLFRGALGLQADIAGNLAGGFLDGAARLMGRPFHAIFAHHLTPFEVCGFGTTRKDHGGSKEGPHQILELIQSLWKERALRRQREGHGRTSDDAHLMRRVIGRKREPRAVPAPHRAESWNRKRGQIVELSNPNAALLPVVCGNRRFLHEQGVKIMFAILAILLVIAWGLALFAFHVTGFFIHIVLVLAVALFIVHLVTGRNQSA